MAKVSNIKIILQSGTDNTYFATWDFTAPKSSSSSSVTAGCTVSIKSGATYYNGVSIPSGVMSRTFKVKSVNGDRAVLGASTDGQYKDINSPVNTKYLTVTSGGSTTSSVPANTLDHYKASWYYYTGQNNKDGSNIWFEGGSSEVTSNQSQTYSPPENATKIRIKVVPVSKKYKVGDTEKSYWTGANAYQWFNLSYSPPDVPSGLSVDLERYSLTATVEGITDSKTDQIQFQLYNDTAKLKTVDVTVKACRASTVFTVAAGGNYRVRCRAVNITTGTSKTYSEWTALEPSSPIASAPETVTNVKCVANSKDEFKVTWNHAVGASKYEIQYTTKSAYFDTSSNVSSTSVEGVNAAYISVEGGHTYHFRVRALNDADEMSGWSSIVSAVIGTVPEPPTTWSLASNVVVGEDITLYWVHNSEDGSKMTSAIIELDIGGTVVTATVPGTVDEDEDEPIYSYKFATSAYTDGAEIKWKVQTKGVVSKYSGWSTQRTINLHAQPTLELGLSTNEDELLTTYPLVITATAGPTTQMPLSYHVSVVNVEAYESVDATGSEIMLSAGTELYSKIFITSERELTLELSAGDILLENGQTYKAVVTASMNSGLTAEETLSFMASWEDYIYTPDASIGIDYETLSASITPFCMDEEGNLIDDVTLSVYRREFNGLFTAIATGIVNNGINTVTDPHPSLDLARYRIVAQNATTGAICYEDLPGEPIQEHSIVIQWDENWTDFDYTEEAAPEVRPWTGSMLRFPYNVDVTEKYSPDVALVNYIGREHPVSFYGTHRGESASWASVIPATDKETLYALRRLASWRGDVYVREPSGTGYWANVKVTFPQKHKEVTVPVSFEIARVEGGI